MARTGWRRRGCLLCVLGLVAAIALVPFQVMVWDGGFVSAEYRLTFTDGTGRPVPGVALQVQTRSGGASHLYPINEFLPDQVPTSDGEGRMVFHHVGEGLEFGGRDYTNLLGMRLREAPPEYVCIFSVGGQEVHRVRYNDLQPRDEWDRLPRVTREWQHTDWPQRELVAHAHDWSGHRLRLFDGNGDGQLDREERIAAGYFKWVAERFESEQGKRDIKFVVIERAITISAP